MTEIQKLLLGDYCSKGWLYLAIGISFCAALAAMLLSRDALAGLLTGVALYSFLVIWLSRRPRQSSRKQT